MEREDEEACVRRPLVSPPSKRLSQVFPSGLTLSRSRRLGFKHHIFGWVWKSRIRFFTFFLISQACCDYQHRDHISKAGERVRLQNAQLPQVE